MPPLVLHIYNTYHILHSIIIVIILSGVALVVTRISVSCSWSWCCYTFAVAVIFLLLLLFTFIGSVPSVSVCSWTVYTVQFNFLLIFLPEHCGLATGNKFWKHKYAYPILNYIYSMLYIVHTPLHSTHSVKSSF